MALLKVMYIWNDVTMGGAAQSLLDLLQGIKNKVQPVVIIRQNGKMEECLLALEIKYYIVPFLRDEVEIGKRTKEMAEQNFKDNYEAALKIVDIIHQENIELVHINSSVSNVGAIAALMAGIPYIWHIRELLQEHFGYDFIDNELKYELFSRAEMLISISDCVQQAYKEKGLLSVRLYNGINISRYRREINTKKDFFPSFLMVGMIAPEKGQLDAIKAVELLMKDGYRKIKLTIVGNGGEDYLSSLEKYVYEKGLEENICFFTFQNDLKRFREAATYSITGSKMEALGRSTIEAMLAGNIVIGADTGGTREIIGEEQKRGYLYQQGNYRSLAETMRKAMAETDEQRVQRLQIAQKYAENTFNLDDFSEKLYVLYTNALKKKPIEKNVLFIQQMQMKYISIVSKYYEKLERAYQQTCVWLRIKQRGGSLGDYFKKYNIRNIAIYGMSYLGWRLYDELKEAGIKVRYVMDKNPKVVGNVLTYVNPDDEFPEVDAIIVTVASQQNEIVNWLQTRCSYKIIGLVEILDYCDVEISKFE